MGMKVVFLAADEIPALPPTCAAIGYFDGFHIGHRQLIDKACSLAKSAGLKSALITFDPDPWFVFKKDANKDHLLSLTDKAEMAGSFGLDYLYVLHFDAAFASKSIESFHEILMEMNVKKLVCGFDFTYGHKGMGNAATLMLQKNFEVSVIDEVDDQDEKISTTRIERMLRAGLVKRAAGLLGYYYSIPGVVVHGYKRGGQILQMPTANLQPAPGYVLPANGVYAGYVYDGKQFRPAMINVGSNPTFNNGELSIEAHIFDFDNNLYGRMVRFFFAYRLRPEKRFKNIQDLRAQLDKDQITSRELLSHPCDLLGATVDLWSSSDSFDILEK